jgi:hypothetical protein
LIGDLGVQVGSDLEITIIQESPKCMDKRALL